jgi:hypothetical protein
MTRTDCLPQWPEVGFWEVSQWLLFYSSALELGAPASCR